MPFCLEQARVRRRRHRQISVISTSSISSTICGGDTVLGDIEGLKRSIRRVGLLSPLLVRARGAGRYQLIAGARRLAACQALGMDEVECIVMPALDEECLLAALGENACRAAPAPDAVRAIRNELSARHGYAEDELDELSGGGWCGWEAIGDEGGASTLMDSAAREAAYDASAAASAAPAPQSRRVSHGYVRDARLIVNAVSDVVDKLRSAGMDARMSAYQASDGMNISICFPCAKELCGAQGALWAGDMPKTMGDNAGACAGFADENKLSSIIEGEHSIEFCDMHGENAQLSRLTYCDAGANHADYELDISDIGRELAHIADESPERDCDFCGDCAELGGDLSPGNSNLRCDNADDIADFARHDGIFSARDDAMRNDSEHETAHGTGDGVRTAASCASDSGRISAQHKPDERSIMHRHDRHSAQHAEDMTLAYSPRRRTRGAQACAGHACTASDTPPDGNQVDIRRDTDMHAAAEAPSAESQQPARCAAKACVKAIADACSAEEYLERMFSEERLRAQNA